MAANPLGPPGYPFLGHLPAFLKDKLGFLLACANNYGDVIKLRIGETTFLLNNPLDIEHVLIKNPQNYRKSNRMITSRGKKISGDGLLTTTSEAHLRQRRMLQPIFSNTSISKFTETIVNTTLSQINMWEDGQIRNIADEMTNLTQRIMLKSLFGNEIEDDQIEELAAAIKIRRSYIQYIFGSLLPFPEYFPNRINFKYRKAIKKIDDFIYSQIRKRSKKSNNPNDFLSLLMNSSYKDGSFMNEKLLRDEIITLSITGYETIGEALSWTLLLISQHPDVSMKVGAEVGKVFREQQPACHHVESFPYLKMVFYESMRLYPPTWIFIRMALEPDVLPSGFEIKGGSKLYLCQYVMHRNPAYFPDPTKFNPNRFSKDAIKSRPKLAYFPFGDGARRCIGESFALLEGILVLACILRHFNFELMPNQEITPEPGITLRPKNGIMMRLKKRISAEKVSVP